MAAPTCVKCSGRALVGGHCLGHLGPEELSAIAGLISAGKSLDARDAEISQAALARFLAIVRQNTGSAQLPKVDFGGATFRGTADFGGVSFKGEARFSGTTFDAIRFDGASFHEGARFRDATFLGKSYFRGTQFGAGVTFVRARFSDDVKFERATVTGVASFSRAHFEGSSFFRKAEFHSSAKFDAATFDAVAKFDQVHFRGNVEFRGAELHGETSFFSTRFGRHAMFEQVKLESETDFKRVVFEGTARFHRASFSHVDFARGEFHEAAIFDKGQFGRVASFNQVRFGGSAGFRSTRFSATTTFSSARFSQDATFERSEFDGNLRLADVRFEGETRFGETHCKEAAIFRRAVFKSSRELGLIKAERVDLDGAVFEDRIRIEVSAHSISGIGVTFSGGTQLRVDRADIVLENADFVRQSAVLGLASRPRLLSLRGAQVAPLALSSLDLRLCRFFGAHGLESMNVEASCYWPSAPAGWMLTRRETIAEEHRWRDEHQPDDSRLMRWPSWQSLEMASSGRSDRPLTANQIANLYRSLRKAREDSKDAAGAGDLYYGEMEMRRHARTPRERSNLGERAVLTAYWMASGYGLRATRALTCLSLVLLSGAALLLWFGFSDPTYEYGRALIFAVESAISLLRPPEEHLTAGGEVVQIFLRLLGPLFFGLALLALRARVKR
jgi:uncharacterized protein YjbI with pentapeptide repeats